VSRDLTRSDVRASPCFTRHLNLNPRASRKLDTLDLEAKIMKDCDAWQVDELLIDLRKNMDDPGPERTEAGDNLMRILLIYAMGAAKEEHVVMLEHIGSPNSYAWSFCKDRWVPRRLTVHCEHCETCGTCKAGRTLACDGCGGWSEDGLWIGEDGPKAPDAHKAQRGLFQVSPRKRARDLEPWNDSVSEVSA
jgi:hypothetical protein